MSKLLQQPTEVLAALIALAGVVLSVLVAWWTSRKTVGVENQKLRVQLPRAVSR